MQLKTWLVLALSACTLSASAQRAPRLTAEQRFLKQQISSLTRHNMAGRGYVRKGVDNAAKHLARQYRRYGLRPLNPDSSYFQDFYFPVNTFPGQLSLRLNRTDLQPGSQFLVDAGSSPLQARRYKVRQIDLRSVHTQDDWNALKLKMGRRNTAWLLQHTDTLCKRLKMHPWRLSRYMPAGTFIVPASKKLIWTVATDSTPSTIFYVPDTLMPRRSRRLSAQVETRYERDFRSRNVIGMVPGTERPDSFIVFTAHFDHLGMMGTEATFNGASDNASGTAMMLYLARYFAANPQRYSVAFMAFSGEEAGLIGSKHYTEHPFFPLKNIRFLLNLDIMGDATAGISVINATEHAAEFELLQSINAANAYLSDIRSRGKAANSDHHHFSEQGVPAFFIHANSGPGFYHDVFDQPHTLSLNKLDKVIRLITDFTKSLTASVPTSNTTTDEAP